MKVIRAGVLGFCMGVRRAYEMARRESGLKGRRVYTLGPLIHNPSVLEDLGERGVSILEPGGIPGVLENSTVIIRAHGVSPAVERELALKGLSVLDATCPHVKASQNKVRDLSRLGFTVFLAGEKDHGEIVGIRGYIEGPCFVIANPLEAEAAATELARDNPGAKTALVAQTTLSQEEYFAIGEAIKRRFPELEMVNTICGATGERQDALRELSAHVDGFVISGGRESANTRRLLSIAEGCGKKAWLVENASGIPDELSSCSVIGLAAGASTPDSVIDAIEQKLLSL